MNLQRRTTSPTSSSYVTPAVLQKVYNITTEKATQSNNRLGVTGYGLQFSSKADLKACTLYFEANDTMLKRVGQLFLDTLRTDAPLTADFDLQTLDGGENIESQPGVEAVRLYFIIFIAVLSVGTVT